jgi:hypothetical protein
VSVPWIGSDYFQHRLCVVAINQNCYGGLGAHWWITRGAIEDLKQNRGGKRPFHLNAGRYLAALFAALDSQPLPDVQVLEGPEVAAAAASAWSRCAFHEAVKCAPTEDRSKPTTAMWRNCPPRYLQDELKILAPKTILAIGRPTWEAMKGIGAVEGTDYGKAFWRGVLDLDGEPAEVFFVNHPAFGNWRSSLSALVMSLRTTTLRVA